MRVARAQLCAGDGEPCTPRSTLSYSSIPLIVKYALCVTQVFVPQCLNTLLEPYYEERDQDTVYPGGQTNTTIPRLRCKPAGSGFQAPSSLPNPHQQDA
jgi:hypothetical protein